MDSLIDIKIEDTMFNFGVTVPVNGLEDNTSFQPMKKVLQL